MIVAAFVKPDESWDHRGPEIPLTHELFEVSAFHQIHCLVSHLMAACQESQFLTCVAVWNSGGLQLHGNGYPSSRSS
jgi:hypothetical protein